MATMRWMEAAFCLMKEAVRWASVAAEGMARDPPGWKSFWMSIRRRVVMVAFG